MSYISLDTGVIAEYIDLAGSLHREAEIIMRNVLGGRLLAIIAHPILVETYYISARIYERLGLSNSEERAEKLIEWLYRSPNLSLAEPSLELAILAGKVKRKFGLALTDAYVLASAKLYGGKALFRSKEKEMVKRLNMITDEYDVAFLQ
jgi:predicted nucleic acid-binding protein